jgi:hypothetical protein
MAQSIEAIKNGQRPVVSAQNNPPVPFSRAFEYLRPPELAEPRQSLPLLLLVVFLFSAPGALCADDLLQDFQPSERTSEFGKVSKVQFSTGRVDLRPNVLVYSPPGLMRDLHFSEPVWVIGYKSAVVDRGGQPTLQNYLCHTFFGDQKVVQRQDQRMRAVYSDGFTPEVRLPEGYGLPLTPHDDLHWMPMFNNRDSSPTAVEMRIEVTVIRQKDLVKPLRRVYSTLRSVQVPHLFYVPPKRHEQQTTFPLTFNGRIHYIGTHIHPHGESIELFNMSRGERVWMGSMKKDADHRALAMETYSSAEGYPVRAGEVFRLTSVYRNPTTRPIDAMAAVFVFYSLAD